jgi:hypothetical protein
MRPCSAEIRVKTPRRKVGVWGTPGEEVRVKLPGEEESESTRGSPWRSPSWCECC